MRRSWPFPRGSTARRNASRTPRLFKSESYIAIKEKKNGSAIIVTLI